MTIKVWGAIDSEVKQQIEKDISFKLVSFGGTHTLVLVNNSDVSVKVDMQQVIQFDANDKHSVLLEKVYYYALPNSESHQYINDDGINKGSLDFLLDHGHLVLVFVTYGNTDEPVFDYLAMNQRLDVSPF